MTNEKDWATPTLKEAPFWRDGMTPEEYEVERKYYYEHFYCLVKKGIYTPLWKQGIKPYDTVRLKSGETACIVEMLGDNKICYVADVAREEGTETDFIYSEDIAEVLG